MGQNKNFIAARLPQELYDRLEAEVKGEKGKKTQTIVQAIAAYLNFPLKATNTAADNEEKFTALEDRIAQLEQQFEELKDFVIKGNQGDNKDKMPVIVNDSNSTFSDSSNGIESDISTNVNISNSIDKKKAPLVPLQDDGSIGPAPEAQIADHMGIRVRSLRYYRKTLKDSGKPLNQPKRVEYNNKQYDLVCSGESKFRGKLAVLWTAKPVINLDNKIYQPDIIEYQVDNSLAGFTEIHDQENKKQDPESSKPNDNNGYQKLSEQSDFNEKLNEQQQNSGEQLSEEQQTEEQPEF